MSLYPSLDAKEVDENVQAVVFFAQNFGVDPLLAVSTAVVDSGFDRNKIVKTKTGCKVGLYQISIKGCDKDKVKKFQTSELGASAGVFFLMEAQKRCGELPPEMAKDCRDRGYYLVLMSSDQSYYANILSVRNRIVTKLNKIVSAVK